MPSPRKSSRSPARTRARPKSPARTKTTTRSRSRSSSRNPKSVVTESAELEETKIVRKLPTRNARSTSKSPSRTIVKEGTATRRTVTSTVFSSVSLSASSSASSSAQEQTLVTPLRNSSLISSLIEKEKQESQRQREQLKLEMMSHITTPPPKVEAKTEIKRPHYEYMGPFGALFLIIMVPTVVFYVNCISLMSKPSSHFQKCELASLFEVEAMLAILAWLFFQAFLAVLPVGRLVEGQPLKSGGRLKYRCNGLIALVVTFLLLGVAVYFQLPVTKVLDNYHKLMAATIILGFTLSICLYVKSRFVREQQLSPEGNTGNIIYDFFVGHELNPRIGMLDLKFFFELRPGVIGLAVLDWIMLIKACQEAAAFPATLALLTLFQTVYIVDAFWFEDAFLSTMEIAHDGCGFLITWGSIALLPFFFSFQSRFILDNSFTLPWYCLAFIAVMNSVGYSLYRLPQIQKWRVRNNPNHPAVSGLKSLTTKTNEKLLISGWWGICRKPIYLGDIIMAFSWSLTTGFGSIVTYCYPIYLLIMLIHRERRDNEKCQKKYGATWDRYCEKVKYRIFPYIY